LASLHQPCIGQHPRCCEIADLVTPNWAASWLTGLTRLPTATRGPPPVGFGKDRHRSARRTLGGPTRCGTRSRKGISEIHGAGARRPSSFCQQVHEEAAGCGMSRLFGETLRRPPAGIESTGHQFLLRAGTSASSAGAFLLPPARLAVMMHIEQVSREELTASGAWRLSFARRATRRALAAKRQVSEDRCRAHGFRTGATGHGLAMTHERGGRSLAAGEYQLRTGQLPRLVCSDQTQWRDDPRRGRDDRAREFT